jgi:hypothetical protein
MQKLKSFLTVEHLSTLSVLVSLLCISAVAVLALVIYLIIQNYRESKRNGYPLPWPLVMKNGRMFIEEDDFIREFYIIKMQIEGCTELEQLKQSYSLIEAYGKKHRRQSEHASLVNAYIVRLVLLRQKDISGIADNL